MKTILKKNEQDCKQSELERISCLSLRLRKLLRFDAPTPEESEIETTAREAAIALDNLVIYAQKMETWETEGEKLFGKLGICAMFSLGAWWADRPWRRSKK